MTRLIHSDAGALRAMQISSVEVFAFVEGGMDRPFAEKLLAAYGLEQHKFRIFAIKEVNNGTGGKQAVLQHFRKFRQQGKLIDEAWGKRFLSLFFVDKDVDDLLKIKLRSPHLIYTPTYDIEGVLFYFGNITKALSEACLITTSQALDLIGDAGKWLQNISKNWIDWIVLCLISQKKKQNLGYTFDRPSCINPDPLTGPDAQELSQCKHNIRTRLNMSVEAFEKYYAQLRKRVSDSIESGEYLKYFKGKWLKLIFQKKIESSKRIDDSNTNSIGEKMASLLLAQVATSKDCKCVRYYHPILSNVLSLL